jgi:uncharacterized protein
LTRQRYNDKGAFHNDNVHCHEGMVPSEMEHRFVDQGDTNMKRMLAATAAALALFAASGCATGTTAGSAPAATPSAIPVAGLPAMWKVQDADTTIYLFGTYHLLPEGRDWFGGPIRAAFESSGELRMELASLDPSPAEMGAMMQRGMVAPGTSPLMAGLNDEQKKAMLEALAKLGIPAAAADAMRPWLVTLFLAAASASELGLSPEHGPEKVLAELAAEAGKPVSGFETFEQQIGFFADMPDEEVMKALKISLDDWANLSAMSREMVTAWQTGQSEELERLMNKAMKDSPGFRKVLLEDRNRAWARWIDERMDQPGTVFVAVGAGHLGGHDAVQVYLREAGHTAVQVTGSR